MPNEEKAVVVLDQKAIDTFDPENPTTKLLAMVAKTSGITATDLNDKAQMALVKENRIELKKTRVMIEKFGKSLRDEATKFNRLVSGKEKELIAIIAPEEDRLQAIEDIAAENAIREERTEKLPMRKERLANIGDNVIVTDEELLMMDANQFEGYFNARMYDKMVADKKVDLERKAKEQAERDAEARKKEEEILKREKAIEEKRLENERKEAALKAEEEARRREEKARAEERENARKEEEKRLEQAKQAKIDEENRVREEKERLEKAERYRNWRKQHGWSDATKAEFKEEKVGETIILWKKVDTFNLKGVK